ncbi:MAG: lipopolysaccharide biosynthesis protein [Prevotella sp.]|nr:lipopolysaccharide biosynthesis protein [Prevotella sp.]
MNKRGIYYLLHNGKNSNLKYYIKCFLLEHTPRCFFQMRLEHELSKLDKRPDKDDILRRVDYYCKLVTKNGYNQKEWEEKAIAVKDQPMTNQSTYYHDSMEIARYFDEELRWVLLSGDTKHIPVLPSITKSRPLAGDNTNNVILKLDKNRHFLFVDDKKQWRNKKDIAIFRGDLGTHKENREVFMNLFAEGKSKMVDAASTNHIEAHPNWQAGKLTIDEHLDYKFIMSLEGNDVASNLKWVMSSNSIAVTPQLTCETWFMEGTLRPNYHYIEVKEDFSDLEERLQYYIGHPEEAEAIIQHAHEFVDQFRDKEREHLTALLVMKKYFEITNGRYRK